MTTNNKVGHALAVEPLSLVLFRLLASPVRFCVTAFTFLGKSCAPAASVYDSIAASTCLALIAHLSVTRLRHLQVNNSYHRTTGSLSGRLLELFTSWSSVVPHKAGNRPWICTGGPTQLASFPAPTNTQPRMRRNPLHVQPCLKAVCRSNGTPRPKKASGSRTTYHAGRRRRCRRYTTVTTNV